jgi:ADP-ribose pyrophosphatase
MSYQVIDKQLLYTGQKLRLEVHHLEDEISGRRIKREIVVHPGAVVILPFLDAETILLIRNRRYAVGQILIELPAGTLERNEDPINCAGRELLEETGHLAGRLTPLRTFFTSPGIMSEKMYSYAAYDLEPQQRALEEGEDIELVSASFDQAIQMIHDGQIQDGKSIATLLLYERFFRRG